MNAKRGWTLVEILISLAILAVLLSLLIPVLRAAISRSQTAKNMANMRSCMQDFFVWSGLHHGRMVNMGLPQDREANWFYNPLGDGEPPSIESRIFTYPGVTRTWPLLLFRSFGEASPHWQSTYSNPLEWVGDGATPSDLQEVKSTDPDWIWSVPTLYVYSPTMVTRSDAWRYPGMGLSDINEFAESFAYVLVADISHPSSKGVLMHDILEEGPGTQRLVAFADGSASQRDLMAAKPAAAHPLSNDPNRRGNPVHSTMNGHRGSDW